MKSPFQLLIVFTAKCDLSLEFVGETTILVLEGTNTEAHIYRFHGI